MGGGQKISRLDYKMMKKPSMSITARRRARRSQETDEIEEVEQ